MANKSPITPGDVISRLMTKYNISVEEGASAMQMNASVLRGLIIGDIKISPALCFKLEKVFKDNSAQFWFTLQQVYDQFEFDCLQQIKYGGEPNAAQTMEEITSAIMHDYTLTKKENDENT